MTLEEVASLASSFLAGGDSPPLRADTTVKLAQWIVDNLAEAAPCGYDAPKVGETVPPCVLVPSWVGGATPEDARAMARMLLVAADAAEKRASGHGEWCRFSYGCAFPRECPVRNGGAA